MGKISVVYLLAIVLEHFWIKATFCGDLTMSIPKLHVYLAWVLILLKAVNVIAISSMQLVALIFIGIAIALIAHTAFKDTLG